MNQNEPKEKDYQILKNKLKIILKSARLIIRWGTKFRAKRNFIIFESLWLIMTCYAVRPDLLYTLHTFY